MRAGMVIGFRDKKDLALAYVVEVGADKVRLVTEKGKEFSFPADKVLTETGRVLTLGRSRDDLVTELCATRKVIDDLRAQVVLSDLWELLVGSEDGFLLERLTGDYFGPESTGEHRCAMLAELLNDSVFFKQKGDAYIPRTEEQVREILRQKDVEDRRMRDRDLLIAWGRELLRGGPPGEPPPGNERFLGMLKSFVLGNETTADGPELAALLKDLGLSDVIGAFDLLVRAGVWSEDENLLIHRYQVPVHFGKEALLRQDLVVEQYADQRPLLDQPDRVDLTSLHTFTIDDPDTDDIDDAVSIEEIPGGFRVGIHIADVAEFVLESDAVDQDAFRRGLTLYLPDRKIQMLPDGISLKIASLVAGEVHAALSVLVDLDEGARVVSYKLCRSAIRVSERLSYESVDGLFSTRADLKQLLSLSELLRRQRIATGAFVFNVPDVKVRVEPDGHVWVRKVPNDTNSHTLVSEMMILANRLVAQWFLDNKIPAIYRLQMPPDEPVSLVGYEPVAFFRVRRQIKRTEVSSIAKPHSGLGIPAYVQMSSPIRRYADLAIHRQIRSVLTGAGPCYTQDDISSIINATERAQEAASLVQKEAHRYWLLKYLKKMVGLTVPGLVLDRREDSYVVQLIDFLLEVTLYQRPDFRYEVGDSILVKLVEIEPRRGYIKCHDAGRVEGQSV